MTAPVLYVYDEAAKILRCSVPHLRKQIRQLPHRRNGRLVTFTDEDLAAIAESWKSGPAQVAESDPSVTSIRPSRASRRRSRSA